MEKQKTTTLGIIHAASITTQIIKPYLDEIIPNIKVLHICDDTIERDNSRSLPGIIPKHNFYKFATYARFFEESGVDLILLACSTFSPAVDVARPMITTPMLQIDKPMMEKALDFGKRIGLVATLPSTVPASVNLLKKAAMERNKKVDVETIVCDEAFEVLRSGDRKKHNEILLSRIGSEMKRFDVIILAQLSMSALEDELKGFEIPVLTSARTGLERVKQMLLR